MSTIDLIDLKVSRDLEITFSNERKSSPAKRKQ